MLWSFIPDYLGTVVKFDRVYQPNSIRSYAERYHTSNSYVFEGIEEDVVNTMVYYAMR